jgi:hypothetical protein
MSEAKIIFNLEEAFISQGEMRFRQSIGDINNSSEITFNYYHGANEVHEKYKLVKATGIRKRKEGRAASLDDFVDISLEPIIEVKTTLNKPSEDEYFTLTENEKHVLEDSLNLPNTEYIIERVFIDLKKDICKHITLNYDKILKSGG